MKTKQKNWEAPLALMEQISDRLNGDEACTFIPLTQGQYAIVDIDDYPLVKGHTWRAHRNSRNWYAVTGRAGSGHAKLHRLVLGLKPGDQDVDHENGDGLDNRRLNLRLATNTENQRNQQKSSHQGGRPTSSRWKGVSWHKDRLKWQARISIDGKTIYLGYFISEIAAAASYDRAAREVFGAFARLNFPNFIFTPTDVELIEAGAIARRVA